MKTSEMVRAHVHPRTKTQLGELPVSWDFSSCLEDKTNNLIAIQGNYNGLPLIFQKRTVVKKNENRGNIELQILFENGAPPISGHKYRQLIKNFQAREEELKKLSEADNLKFRGRNM